MRTFGKVLQWVAIGYGVLVVVTTVIVCVLLAQPTEGANFAGVWLVFATLPFSLATMWVPVEGAWFIAVLTATGLLQALGLWLLGRLVIRRP